MRRRPGRLARLARLDPPPGDGARAASRARRSGSRDLGGACRAGAGRRRVRDRARCRAGPPRGLEAGAACGRRPGTADAGAPLRSRARSVARHDRAERDVIATLDSKLRPMLADAARARERRRAFGRAVARISPSSARRSASSRRCARCHAAAGAVRVAPT